MLMRSPGKFRRQMAGCSLTNERGVPNSLSRFRGMRGYGFDFMSLFGDSGGQQAQPQIAYDQYGNPVYVQQQQGGGGGGFWSEVTKGLIGVTAEVTKGVGSIGNTIGFIAHPEEYAARSQSEALTAQAQAYAVGQQTEQLYAQVELEKAKSRKRMWTMLIGGVTLVGGGLVFAKILRRT